MTGRGVIGLALMVVLAGCGHVSEYEKAVADREPVYCYRNIGGVSCYAEPHFRDERRLVNYFGPAPARYERPEPPAPARLDAPPPVATYVRDAEPVPRAAPHGPLADRPWLTSDHRPAIAVETGVEAVPAPPAAETEPGEDASADAQ